MTTTASKRPFSLLEMVVVLAILAFIGSLVGVKGKDLIEHYTFSSAIDKVSSRCKLAQSLAENYQTDVQVQIIRTRNGVDIALQSDEPPLQKLPQFAKPLHIRNIVEMRFNEEVSRQVTVLFSGSGAIFPEGILHLQGTKKGKEIPFLLSEP